MSHARVLALRPRSPRQIGALLLAASVVLSCKVSGGSGPAPAAVTPEPAAEATPPATPPEIDVPRMLADLEQLSSDQFAGRFTFSENLGQAADHLAAQYRKAGIEPVGTDYRVPFVAPAGSEPGDELTVWVEDDEASSHQVAGKELVTLGNGSGEAVYADAVAVRSLGSASATEVRGKVVIAPAPPGDDLIGAVTRFAERGAAGLMLIGEGTPPDPAQTRGPLGALTLPVAWIDAAAAQDWMGVQARGKRAPRLPAGTRVSMAAKREVVEKEAFNVIAFIPGTQHPEQLVVLGAHYDHIGTTEAGVMCRAAGEDTICNGADDNASGTVMVLEIARAFAQAHVRPDRTVVFAHFAGEELGLYGSKALASEPPDRVPFRGGKVVAMVNLDMVGRLGDKGLAIGGLSSSDAWMPLLDELGSRELPIVYERAINARSDHASFYRHKVPVLFFFTGLHDDYHQVGDHFDKINGEGMATIAQLVADLTLSLANGREVPYAAPRTEAEGVVARMPGADESTVEKRTGGEPGKPAHD